MFRICILHLRELCLALLESDERLRGHIKAAEVEAAFDPELAAQAAIRAAAPQLAALRLAADTNANSTFNN